MTSFCERLPEEAWDRARKSAILRVAGPGELPSGDDHPAWHPAENPEHLILGER
jgi:hypothetical protein